MQKKVLTEQSLYSGNVDMPKGWDIDRDKLQTDILKSKINNTDFPFSRTFDMLTTYMREHINVDYGFTLINKATWGNVYKPQEITVKDCNVRIHYEDNRRKGRSWDIELTDNKFIMFPSTNMYYITNNQKDSLNFIQTITYEYI